MKPIIPPSPGADEQAALWAARLDGSVLGAADRGALDAWLAAHPAHRELLAGYCQFSADLEKQLPLLAGIRDEVAGIQTAHHDPRPRSWLHWPIWAGAALAAAVVVAVVLWRDRPQNLFQNLATPVAQRQAVTIGDGTRVELNAQTALVVELRADERRVRLATGEAFFSVTKDPARPFYVETPGGVVRVTGTQFNVRVDEPAALQVTVLDGTVQVRPTGETNSRTLGAGDQLACRDQSARVQALDAQALTDALAWRQGQVVFDGTPLRDALDRFARYHGRSLTASDRVAGLHVGGRFALDDLNGFLVSLEEALPVRVVRDLQGAVTVDAPTH